MTEKTRPRVRVAGILIEDDKILLIEHTKNDKKYWLVPGGGVDWGESAAEALTREFKEHVINLYFKIKKAENSSNEMKLGDEDILTDLRFVPKDEIQNIKLYPNIKEKLIKLLNKETIEPYLGLLWDK